MNNVKIFLLPGGTLPARMTDGAIGFDVYLRAIVSPTRMASDNPNLRQTLFDFEKRPRNQKMARRVHRVKGDLVYRLGPRESVLVGIGFVTEMKHPMFFWVAPRSGLASKHGIQVTNAPGTVDPDYRGEAGVLVHNCNSRKTFDLQRDMRIAQIVFQEALIPEFVFVRKFENLSVSGRGVGGFGSTGLKG